VEEKREREREKREGVPIRGLVGRLCAGREGEGWHDSACSFCPRVPRKEKKNGGGKHHSFGKGKRGNRRVEGCSLCRGGGKEEKGKGGDGNPVSKLRERGRGTERVPWHRFSFLRVLYGVEKGRGRGKKRTHPHAFSLYSLGGERKEGGKKKTFSHPLGAGEGEEGGGGRGEVQSFSLSGRGRKGGATFFHSLSYYSCGVVDERKEEKKGGGGRRYHLRAAVKKEKRKPQRSFCFSTVPPAARKIGRGKGKRGRGGGGVELLRYPFSLSDPKGEGKGGGERR